LNDEINNTGQPAAQKDTEAPLLYCNSYGIHNKIGLGIFFAEQCITIAVRKEDNGDDNNTDDDNVLGSHERRNRNIAG
jgi:hypothetical protein